MKRDGIKGPWSGWSDRRFKMVLYVTAACLYALGVWLHIPYGGGHIYSDIDVVFQNRICNPPCTPTIPYVQSFIEYPVIVAMFIYAMGVLALSVPGALVLNYYLLTSLFLAIPTLLLVREMLKIMEMRDIPRGRAFLYFVVTPTFVYMILVNWYVIGVYFAVSGIRKHLEGRPLASGILFGLSAASNLITAVPAIGLLISSRRVKEALSLAAAGGGSYLLINAPFLLTNSNLWFQAFQYVYNWNIENSWMMTIIGELSPARHLIPPLVFGGIAAVMLFFRYRKGPGDPLVFAFVSMFGYVFATYIYTPQMNLTLLPFFALLPVADSYWEFLAFDTANSLIIILGFSQALLPLGITYDFQPMIRFGSGTAYGTLIWWLEVIRSLWVGKFALFNGVSNLLFAPKSQRMLDQVLGPQRVGRRP